MKNIDIWIVGKKDSFTEQFINKINNTENFTHTCSFENPDKMVNSLNSHKPQIIIIDFEDTGSKPGLRLIKEILTIDKSLKIIVLLPQVDEKTIYSAICIGAFDYYIKSQPLSNIEEKLTEVINSSTPLAAVLKNKIKKSFESVASVEKEYNLTNREKEVLNLVIGGLTKRKIAEILILSFHTIDSHLRNIYRKLGVQSKSQAISKALKEQLVLSE